MLRFLGAILVGVAFVGPAAAQSIGGKYNVEGTNLDGSPYNGTAEIRLTSQTTCVIQWKTGPTTSDGFCMRNGASFAAGYVLGNAVGLVVYEVHDDGSMSGLWTIAGKEGNGTENLTLAN